MRVLCKCKERPQDDSKTRDREGKGDRLTDLLRYCLDLGDQRLVDEGAEVEAANVVDEAEVQATELETREIEAVEDTNLAEGQEGLELLELQDGVEVEDVVLEQTREGVDVEVVDLAELSEELEVEAVDGSQVLDVQGVERAKVVELREVDNATALNLLSRSSNGHGGEGRDEEAGGLHFDGVGRE